MKYYNERVIRSVQSNHENGTGELSEWALDPISFATALGAGVTRASGMSQTP